MERVTKVSAEATTMLAAHARETIDQINLRLVRDEDLGILRDERRARLEGLRAMWNEILEATA